MPLMWRAQVRWSGGQIGTGFTNLFFREGVGTAQAANDSVRAFFAAAYLSSGGNLPLGITLTFPTSLDVMEDETGQLLFTVPVTTPGPLTGGDAGVYAAPAGVVVTWRTAGVVNGHRVQGRTFLVPIGLTGLQADGTPKDTFVSQVLGAAAGLISATPEFVIWHRPTSPGASNGSAHTVLAPSVHDTIAMLTSRR